MDVNDAISDWLVKVLQGLGDPSLLHDHALAFRDHARAVRDMHATLAAAVNSSQWKGVAADAHARVWQQNMQLADRAAANLDAASRHLDVHAQHSWAIVKEVIGLVLEISEQLLVGVALTWVAVWFSDLIWLRAAPLVLRVLELLGEFRALLADFAAAMRDLGHVAGKIGGTIEKLVVDYAPAYSRAYLGFYLSDAVPQLMSGRRVDGRSIAWQVGAFVGLDIGVNLAEDAVGETLAGQALMELIVGDAKVEGRVLSCGEDMSGTDEALQTGEATATESTAEGAGVSAAEIPFQLPPLDLPGPLPLDLILSGGDREALASLCSDGESAALGAGRASVIEGPSSVPMAGSASLLTPDAVKTGIEIPRPPSGQTWQVFEAKTVRQSAFEGIKEGFNTAVCTLAMDGIVEKAQNQQLGAEGFAVDSLLGGLMAGARQSLFHILPVGEKFAYRNQPEGAPSMLRWIASTPITWAYYSMYLTLKDGIRNGIAGLPTPTELNADT